MELSTQAKQMGNGLVEAILAQYNINAEVAYAMCERLQREFNLVFDESVVEAKKAQLEKDVKTLEDKQKEVELSRKQYEKVEQKEGFAVVDKRAAR
jgi:hypothetical protein